MTCKLCELRPVPENYGSPRECAFDENGVFTRDNWNCETMNELRTLHDYNDRCDDSAGAISVIRVPDATEQPGYIVLTYYKDRGTVGGARVVSDDDPDQVLTLATAESVVRGRWKNEGIVW